MGGAVSCLHIFRKPSATPIPAGRGATLDDGVKGLIHRAVKAAVAQGFTQAATDAKGRREKDGAGIRAPPEDGGIVVEPGEDARTVGPTER